MFLGVEKSAYGTLVGLVSDDASHVVLTNNPQTLRKEGVFCEEHRTGFRFNRMKAVHNPDVTCSAKCRASTRPDCECACAGKNHGKDALVSGLS
jgi:hypothetical protein